MRVNDALAGKVALVTGAVRRNGRAIARALASEGAAVAINARRSRGEAESVADEIAAAGGKAIVCMADITDEDAVRGMFDAISMQFGRLDILVNNAADRARVPFLEMSLAQWRGIANVILEGAFLCSRSALPMMLENGWGRIVNIGGVGHHMPSYTGRAHAAAAKAGLEGLTRALAMEFAARNITVNCVSPGRIGSEEGRAASAGDLPDPGLRLPVGRTGVPEDIAAAVRFICLPESGFITGQTLHVNGGQFIP